ncbi:hypothetical protein ACJX0J_036342, partial [Zea mays]
SHMDAEMQYNMEDVVGTHDNVHDHHLQTPQLKLEMTRHATNMLPLPITSEIKFFYAHDHHVCHAMYMPKCYLCSNNKLEKGSFVSMLVVVLSLPNPLNLYEV